MCRYMEQLNEVKKKQINESNFEIRMFSNVLMQFPFNFKHRAVINKLSIGNFRIWIVQGNQWTILLDSRGKHWKNTKSCTKTGHMCYRLSISQGSLCIGYICGNNISSSTTFSPENGRKLIYNITVMHSNEIHIVYFEKSLKNFIFTKPSPIFSSSLNYKKGALDSQHQVIKFTSCLPMPQDIALKQLFYNWMTWLKHILRIFFEIWSDLFCLTPLSAIFQLCRGNQFYWWRK
jgi:hypothetical protein